MKHLKQASEAYTHKSKDNIDTHPEMKAILKDWIESLESPLYEAENRIDEIEWNSRDGFIAHSHNRGGFELFSMQSIAHLIGSGYIPKSISDRVTEIESDEYKEIKEDHPEFNDEQLGDAVYESLSNEYSYVGYHVRIMYEGANVLCIHSGFDFDAPYFRWNGRAENQIEIKFKTIADLKKKLAKVKI